MGRGNRAQQIARDPFPDIAGVNQSNRLASLYAEGEMSNGTIETIEIEDNETIQHWTGVCNSCDHEWEWEQSGSTTPDQNICPRCGATTNLEFLETAE